MAILLGWRNCSKMLAIHIRCYSNQRTKPVLITAPIVTCYEMAGCHRDRVASHIPSGGQVRSRWGGGGRGGGGGVEVDSG